MKEFFTSRFDTIKTFVASQELPSAAFFKDIFSVAYWTEGPLDSFSPHYLFGAIILLGALIGLETWRRKLKKRHQTVPVYAPAINQLGNIFFFVLILVPSYWFFRVQQLAFLSGRLLLGLIVLMALVWLTWVVIFLRSRTPRTHQAYLEQERFFRYLPNNSPGVSSTRAKKGKLHT
jgi:hypothetical protein